MLLLILLNYLKFRMNLYLNMLPLIQIQLLHQLDLYMFQWNLNMFLLMDSCLIPIQHYNLYEVNQYLINNDLLIFISYLFSVNYLHILMHYLNDTKFYVIILNIFHIYKLFFCLWKFNESQLLWLLLMVYQYNNVFYLNLSIL